MTTFRKLPIAAPKIKARTQLQLGIDGKVEFIYVCILTAKPAGFNIRRAS